MYQWFSSFIVELMIDLTKAVAKEGKSVSPPSMVWGLAQPRLTFIVGTVLISCSASELNFGRHFANVSTRLLYIQSHAGRPIYVDDDTRIIVDSMSIQGLRASYTKIYISQMCAGLPAFFI